MLAGEHEHLREDRPQRVVDAAVAPRQLRRPVVLRRGQSQREDAAGVEHRPHFLKELAGVEAIDRAGGGFRQVEDDDVEGATGRSFYRFSTLLDVQSPIGEDQRDAGITQDGSVLWGQVSLRRLDQQRVEFDVGHAGGGVLEDLTYVAGHAPPDEEDALWVGVCQQWKVGHLLGECPLRLEGQKAVFEEHALPVAGLDDEAAIGGVGGEGQIGPLPAEGGVVEGAAQGEGTKEQEGQEAEEQESMGEWECGSGSGGTNG